MNDQSNLRWLQRLPLRWAFGGVLLGIVWGLVSSYLLDDRFHETSIGEANRRGTERMLVDSSFEELNEERQHGNMAASA
jgi:hypothetical protein